jgi:hypothetical protein
LLCKKNQLETLKSVAESKDNKGGAGAGASGAAGGKKKGDKPGAGAAGQESCLMQLWLLSSNCQSWIPNLS